MLKNSGIDGNRFIFSAPVYLTMNTDIINKTVCFVKDSLNGAEGGHDWWHVFRVWNLAKTIAAKEKADLFTVELGALLHDIADSKFHNNDEEIGPALAREFLHSLNIDTDIIDHVELMIRNISFKGGNFIQQFRSPELDVVQDADRLDSMGAIGIARTFNYGGFKGREIYNPQIPPDKNMNKEEYMKSTAPSINHFYEKLLLLKDKMNTETGREMADRRHNFMLMYLDEFYRDWQGNY